MDFVSVARQCHNDDPWSDSSLAPLLLSSTGAQIGFLRENVVEAIRNSGGEAAFAWKTDHSVFWIKDDLTTHTERSQALQQVVESWRDQGLFPDPLKGWRNELYAIFGPGQINVFNLERAACALFGVVTFGVHATAYTADYRIWVPRRVSTKVTWPGYLDNSAAGGITAGDLPYESMVRECGEEAGLEEAVVRSSMKQTGVISYFYRTHPAGWVQPEVEFTYDILVDSAIQLHPVDGEAEAFQLMSVDEVLDLMRQGKFKPNCAMGECPQMKRAFRFYADFPSLAHISSEVLIDFLIRHGKLTAENAGCDYQELVCLLHNNLKLPSMRTMK